MGFFKRLKKRLLTLNIDEPIKKNKKNKKIENTIQVSLTKLNLKEKDNISSEFKGIKKKDNFIIENNNIPKSINKADEKLRRKTLAKEKKINKYVAGMKKSGATFSNQLKELQNRHNNIDDSYFEELEEILIMADISVKLVLDIIDEIKKEVREERVSDITLINEIIADKLFVIYTNQSHVSTELNIEENRLNIILIVGVNGSGKTTSIAKLAYNLKQKGKNIILAAADTFRAGAVEQLNVWSKQIGCAIIKSKIENGDPAAVVFDAIKKAKKDNYDVLIIDTAGRLENKVNLMNQLAKMNRIIQKEIQDAPHEILLILDSTTGQNGINQAIKFMEITNLTGIILTKMDGTSKGGIVLSIKDKTNLPVKFLGLGEKLDDLLEFDLDSFIYGLTKELIDVKR